MSVLWVDLSSRWGLSSVQAALNVFISVLGTVGIWSFSRYWWQRESASIIKDKSGVPLSALYNPSNPGEGWDVVIVLRTQVFASENWLLLFQVVIVTTATLACMLNGLIAQASLKNTHTVGIRKLGVLQTQRGDGADGDLIEANVLWNETVESLNQADFPLNQLLDYLPPSTAAWTYAANEWDPTWSVTCNYTAEIVLHNVTGSGTATFYDPINAFPAYRDTYDPSWLDTSKYRMQADFTGWTDNSTLPFDDQMFFILIESDPNIDDRMDMNNETLQISISALHAQHFAALYDKVITESLAPTWRPNGPVKNASFTRVECNITRKPEVPDENAIPWPWTNDTYSITEAFRTNWAWPITQHDIQSLSYPAPTPQELLRFYQAYIATVNTYYSLPSPRNVSVWIDMVQISVVFLVIFAILALLTLCQTGRYFWFLRRNKSKLEQLVIPDGRIEWMIHCAKISASHGEGKEEAIRDTNRDHFRLARFGYSSTDLENPYAEVRRPTLARVYFKGASISGALPGSTEGSLPGSTAGSLPGSTEGSLPGSTEGSLSLGKTQQYSPSLPVEDNKGAEADIKKDGDNDTKEGSNISQPKISVDSQNRLEIIVSPAGEKSQSDSMVNPDRKKFTPKISRKDSADRSRPLLDCKIFSAECGSLSRVSEGEYISPTDIVASCPDQKQ